MKQGLFSQVLLYSLITLLLSSCGREQEQQASLDHEVKPNILYAYPYHGQKDVINSAEITLKLTEAVIPESAAEHFSLRELATTASTEDSKAIDGELIVDENDHSVIRFSPAQALTPGTRYAFSLGGTETANGPVENTLNIQFTTRNQSERFHIDNLSPAAPFPFMDFSSINLRFSRPLDPRSLRWGETLRLIDSQDQLIAASVLHKDNFLTIDPLADLTPGEPYRLILSSDILDLRSQPLDAQQFEFIPQDSQPRSITQLSLSPSAYSNDNPLNSPIAGKEMNSANFRSPLLGDVNEVKLGGLLNAELAYLSHYPDISPFVLRKGTVLQTTGLEVLLGGEVPAALDSGEISMTLIADTVGYIINNPFTDERYANKNIRMYLDVALQTSNPVTNAMLTQSVLQIEVSGTLEIVDGKMKIDALGAMEAQLIRFAEANASMTLHFESVDANFVRNPSGVITQQKQAATRTSKNVSSKNVSLKTAPSLAPLELLTSFPASGDDHINNDDDLTLFFSDIIDADTAPDSVFLELMEQHNSTLWPIDVSSAGAMVLLQPKTPLPFGKDFRIRVQNTLKGLSGKQVDGELLLEFKTATFGNEDPKPPVVKAVYPGFPCAMHNSDLSNNQAGQCIGGLDSDDMYPIFPLPSNRSLVMYFSQPMDPLSMQSGETCDQGSLRVERIDQDGNCIESVAGHWEYKQTRLRFTPDTPWQEGILYRYTLMSNNDNERCDSGELCSATAHPMPLNTDPFSFRNGVAGKDKHGDIGGPPLRIPFRGAPPSTAIFNPLLNAPYTDTNANGLVEANESLQPGNSMRLQVGKTGGIVSAVKIGCNFNKDCPPDQDIAYFNNIMITEIFDYDEALGGVRVHVHPKIFLASSTTMFAKALGGLLRLELPTGTQYIRTRPVNGGPLIGRIITGELDAAGNQQPPLFDIDVKAYLDAPYLNILGGLASTNLQSLPFSLNLQGPVSFLPDGRMLVELFSTNEVILNIDMLILPDSDLTTLFGENNPLAELIRNTLDKLFSEDHVGGSIELKIPAGDVRFHLTAEPLQ
jgi:hypothetical protein